MGKRVLVQDGGIMTALAALAATACSAPVVRRPGLDPQGIDFGGPARRSRPVYGPPKRKQGAREMARRQRQLARQKGER